MYTIRLAKKEDTKQIETIRIKARKDGYQGILEPSYLKVIKATRERIQSFAEYISQSELFLVYEDEKNEIHGFINRGKARDENPQYPYEMYSFYVDPIHQRKGIGTQLFTAFQEQIHHQPFYLWALPGGKGEKFYIKHGGIRFTESTEEIGGKVYPIIGYTFNTNNAL